MSGTAPLEPARGDTARLPGRPPYQDLLRALGHLLDQEGWRQVRITEQPHGIVVTGSRADAMRTRPAALQLTHAELDGLVRAAHRQRGRSRVPAPMRRSRLAALRERPELAGAGGFSAWLAVGCYEARLRAVGWLADAAQLEQVRVREDGADLIIHGRRIEAPDAADAPARLTPGDLQQALGKMARLRGVEMRPAPQTRVLAPADTP